MQTSVQNVSTVDQIQQMNRFKSYVAVVADNTKEDLVKLLAIQDISENFDTILASPLYSKFLEFSIKIFLKILQDGEPHFIAEYNIQQIRKFLLEILHRLPTNDLLRPYVPHMLTLTLKLLEIDNEENVLVCLKIIIELHKQYRPTFSGEIKKFLQFVKQIYSELPKHLNKIFEPRAAIKMPELNSNRIDELLKETFTITTIQTEKQNKDGTLASYNLIPKAVLSLKVIQELPIIVVLMYQLYKESVYDDVGDFIPLIMDTIVLQPTLKQRQVENFNKEIFVDFMGAQIKTLSFLAYIIKIYVPIVTKHSDQLVAGMLGLLRLCPMEVAHLRRELLIASRHILATDLRDKFVSHMESLFDEDVLLGRGWTTHESLRPLAYSTLADLVHHVRHKLTLDDIARAVHLFSKNVHDDSLATTIQTMSCKLLHNLAECIKVRAETEKDKSEFSRELLMRMLEVFVLKFKTIAKIQLPKMMEKCKQQTPTLQTQTSQTIPSTSTPQPSTPIVITNTPPLILLQSSSSSSTPSTPNTPTPLHHVTGMPPIHIKVEAGTESVVPPAEGQPPAVTMQQQVSGGGGMGGGGGGVIRDEGKSKFGFPQPVNYNVSDYRSLVKTLVVGVNTIALGASRCKTNVGPSGANTKQFQPHETLIFIRLVKWALRALDIYTLNVGPQPTGLARLNQPSIRNKDEKEVLEHFSSVFSVMNPQTFHEIFSTTIEYVVDRVYKNGALQIVVNTLLANHTTTPIFATVLVEYLLERMEEMGSNALDRSNLYLRLFKVVFGSVSLFSHENENMLRPHLHQIVNRSMELAMSAKEPFNYFLLLRSLFRSIGGGSHELLYQEFLPLLPNLLEGLNRLQSGLHKPQMKDLFVELCLTVPVRLSSLLPYLPMLMDPLVSALNGSHTLISQGLRTLELCVDNLQHDFLYEHIQPVRADLMQALWRTLRNNDQIAQVAFKVLGKFGGGNRKMMIEPQKLDYVSSDFEEPAIVTLFSDLDEPINFPVQKVIETAFNALNQSTTDSFYRKKAWEVINCYLIGSLDLSDFKLTLATMFKHPSFEDSANIPQIKGSSYKSIHTQSRETHKTALIGMFVAAAIKELGSPVFQVMICIVRHYTIVAVAQQAGAFAITPKPNEQITLDPLVLVDALAVIMAHEEKELCKPGEIVFALMMETATQLLGSKELACKLPLIEYLSERMCSLCYERAWYAKSGGCLAIQFMIDICDLKWVYEHMCTFLKAVLFVMMDLTGEVSSGALDLAKSNLNKMLIVCVSPPPPLSDEDTKQLQLKALCEVTHELVKLVTSPHTLVREQSMHSLRLLAEKQCKSVTAVMEPFRELLADMVPPIKHLLKHQPAIAQMGLMDGNMFCTTLFPRLFTIDVSINEHKLFIDDLNSICMTDDAKLTNISCYKNISNFIPLRTSALKVLAACHYLAPSSRDNIFQTLYQTLQKPNAQLQHTAFQCMKQFIAGYQVEKEIIHKAMRPLLSTLQKVETITLNGLKTLSYLTQLFPLEFKEKLCESLLVILTSFLGILVKNHQAAASATTGITKKGEEEAKIVTIISIFHQTSAATSKFVQQLCPLILNAEKEMMIEASSPFRDVLMKFLRRYPADTLEMFLSDAHITDQKYSRYLTYMLKHKEGAPFREQLQTQQVARLIRLVLANADTIGTITLTSSSSGAATSSSTSSTGSTVSSVATISTGMEGGGRTLADRHEMQYQSIRIVALLIRYDDQWLSGQTELVEAFRGIWCNDDYQKRHKFVDNLDYTHWREPKLLVKILLHYFRLHTNDIDLLFQLLRATCDRFIPEFQFLRDFLEHTVAQEYSVEWKRKAFFLFVEKFDSDAMSQELKAKVIQLILIPCFAVSFEKKETNRLIGSTPAPYQDCSNNIVSEFINKLIDPVTPQPFADCVRISLLQFSCLLVEQASPHIHDDHDANNKAQGFKVRRLMTFAWPCLLGKNCVDAATRYHGHLLLSHIIDKFAIHRKIVLQVFHSLLKAHGLEAKNVVRQALEILTPTIPLRIMEGNKMLTHWTKKIIVDDGHSMQQLFHILQVVVKHYKVYYPVRHNLVQHMVSSIQRLGFSPTATLEHRKLAVELAEVIIKWELNGTKEESENENVVVENIPLKRCSVDDYEPAAKRLMLQPGISVPGSSTASVTVKIEPRDRPKSIDRVHTDTVLNFLLRLACLVNDPPNPNPNPNNPAVNLPGEMLSRRCVLLLRNALKPDVWPQPIDLKLVFFDKILLSVQTPTPNIANIGTALELLTFLLSVLKPDQVLKQFRSLQDSIGACLKSTNNKIIKLVHTLLHKLMGIFPADRPSSNAPKYEELEKLYSQVEKVIAEGFSKYEKDEKASPSSLFGTIMILKAACMNNSSYIDLQIMPFMRILLRIAKEHLQPLTTELNLITSELLILSLDLVKTRVIIMTTDMRKTFIGSILVGLIEKTQDVKVMKAIVKMLEEWMKSTEEAPSIREKSILLVKMMQYVEKRFPEENDLNAQFLELVNYVYTDDLLKGSELAAKLEFAFMAGLRCTQPHIRAKFFAVFDKSMPYRLYDRLMYITCSQNWDAIGSHYWIKQCIELLIVTAVPNTPIKMAHDSSVLPNISAVLNNLDRTKMVDVKKVLSTIKQTLDQENEGIKMETLDEQPFNSRIQSMNSLITKHCEFIETSRDMTTDKFLLAASQLCHMDTSLAEQIWLLVFPKMWHALHAEQRKDLANEIIPFVTSGTHLLQRDCHPSAINTFVEAMSRCKPPIQLSPANMKYLGKCHNLWHRMALGLEQQAFDPPAPSTQKTSSNCYDFEPEPTPKNEILDSLDELYALLCEEDMWAGLWQRHASHYRETGIAIAYEQHGFFEQAQTAYVAAMAKYKQETTVGPVPVTTQREVLLWTDHCIKCAKELNQWDKLLEYSKNGFSDPYLMLESSWRNWRVDNWDSMREALSNVEYNCPKELAWKVTLYGGFLRICQKKPEDPKSMQLAERYVETASIMCLNEWRRLPHIVSHIHLPFLQAAQQIMELQEAYQIRKCLLQSHQNSLHDMKAIVKTWRNRLPVIADDLRHWNDIFTWRQHHYQFIVNECENIRDPNSMLGVHASAQSIIHFGKIARKHKLTNVCLDSLNTIYTITSVPIVDCFQKIRQQIKCYLQQASLNTNPTKTELYEGLEVINKASVKLFAKEMITEFYALKGVLYHLCGQSDEANKTFSAAIQKHDASTKAWGLYGDYLEQMFSWEPQQISLGVNAMTCFLHACRHQDEPKARKFLAKVLWMLSFDDDKSSLMVTLDKYSVGVPPLLWLPWTAQLLNCMILYDGNGIFNLLLLVGKMYPQAVYLPIRTLYFTLRAATARKTNTVQPSMQDSGHSDQSTANDNTVSSGGSVGSVGSAGSGVTAGNPMIGIGITFKAPPAMVRCTNIIKMQQDIHATIIISLEGIADQMEWFRENWYEEVVRQLRQGLTKCYAIAFENREKANETVVTPHIISFVKKVVSIFGIGVENITIAENTVFDNAASESLARRAEDTYQDPEFKEMKQEFTKDFDFSQTNAMKLHLLIHKLKKWIKILENRSKILIQSFLIEEKCRYLSNFTLKTSDLELPGEFLLPKHTHYYVRITRFMPRVDIVQKHNTAARRLYIRGHNGKIYPYLVVNDSGLADARREERVLQLLRMMNLYLGKQKETSRRFLHYTVPRVVAVSPQIRLVEDNPASISLLDIFKKACPELSIVHDSPIHHYYERLANAQVHGTKVSYHSLYRDILTKVQTTMVPKTILKNWAISTFPSATDYWQFRKMFTLQLSLICFAEYVLHLTRLNPDMMYLHQDSGLVNVSYFKFDVNDSTGILNSTRPVPFRLTPNIMEFISTIGISGPLTASMIAAARCIVYPNFKFAAILKPILRDEMILVVSRVKKNEELAKLDKLSAVKQEKGVNVKQEKQGVSVKQEKVAEGEQLVTMVTTAVNAITTRLNSLAHFEGLDSNVNTLVAAVSCNDNLCRMDPAWHPWL